MTAPPTPGALAPILAGLRAALPELTQVTCDQIYRELDSYQGVKREDLESSVARNLSISLTSLIQGRPLSLEELNSADQMAGERFAVGVPVEEVIRGFRISFALIHERFIDLSMSIRLPVDEVIRGSRILWTVGDSFTTRVITTYHGLELQAALANAERRAAIVHAVIAGHTPPTNSALTLDLRQRYAVIRCEVPSGSSAEALRQHLEETGSAIRGGALVVLDGTSCLGLVTKAPDAGPLLVGIGLFGRLEEAPRSDRVARLALQLAQRLGRIGLQGVDQLGWRLAAESRPEVGRLYANRFLAPLQSEGEFAAELRESVLTWLHQGRNIPRAAQTLNVHVNTLRYRLRRYADLTGADFDDLDDLIGVAWALELGDPDQG